MKKFFAITTSTLLLSLLGASGSNWNTNLVVQAANKDYSTVTYDSKGQALIYKNVNLSNCDNLNEVVNKLRANGITNITSNNITNDKALREILSKIGNNTSTNKTTDANTAKVTKTDNSNKRKKSTTTKKKKTTNSKVTTKPTATPTKTPTAAPTKAPTATPTKAPTTTTANNSSLSSYANEVLQLVNKERAKEGLSALTTATSLTSAANHRAKETVQSFSHTRPNGSTFSTVLKEFNVSYRAAGENIAYGQRTPQEVVTGWMNSPGHRANIMNANFGKIGIGVYKASNGTIYWTQLFTN